MSKGTKLCESIDIKITTKNCIIKTSFPVEADGQSTIKKLEEKYLLRKDFSVFIGGWLTYEFK